MNHSKQPKPQIEIAKDGPYLVKGGLPLSEQAIVTNAEGDSHSLSFNLYRHRTEFLDEQQALTQYDQDASGNIITQVNADQTTVAYTWLNGLRMSSTDAFGQTNSYHYDSNGNETTIADCAV